MWQRWPPNSKAKIASSMLSINNWSKKIILSTLAKYRASTKRSLTISITWVLKTKMGHRRHQLIGKFNNNHREIRKVRISNNNSPLWLWNLFNCKSMDCHRTSLQISLRCFISKMWGSSKVLCNNSRITIQLGVVGISRLCLISNKTCKCKPISNPDCIKTPPKDFNSNNQPFKTSTTYSKPLSTNKMKVFQTNKTRWLTKSKSVAPTRNKQTW